MNRLIACAAALALASVASAQDDFALETDASLDLTPEKPWLVQLEPMLWVPALRGDIQLPGGPAFDVEVIDLDENELAPAGELLIRADRWSLFFSGFGFESSGTERAQRAFRAGPIAVAAGAEVDYEFEETSFTLLAGYEVWQLPLTEPAPGGGTQPARDVRVAIDLLAGVRLYDISTRLTVVGGATAAASNTWTDILGGARVTMDFPYDTQLEVASTIGGFSDGGDNSSFSWDITAAFNWAPVENVALQFGFRHLSVDLTEGENNNEFSIDTSLAGLFGSVVIRF